MYEGIGTVVGAGYGRFTDKDNQFWVTEVALDCLDKHSIPYRILPGPKRDRARSAAG
ncbi:hypothetical protein HY634_04425 [Candidatus Uhrbacteria bacterium]|nr:hypothetical protein [Candidatus Uhrbacteria bacterium]